MRNYLFFSLYLITVLSGFSCKNSSTKKDKDQRENKVSTEKLDPPLLGSFVGLFGEGENPNKVTVIISQINENKLEGRSIVGGNDRPFSGTFREENGVFSAEAKEPGDDKYDGVFTFRLSKNNPAELSGNWEPYKPTTKPKKFSLERKKFSYNPNNGNYPQGSLRLLTTGEVENEMKETLAYMRNEIFARHGYCFKKKEWRDMFEMYDWYVPNTADIKVKLTTIEKKNIELIKRYEKYAEEFGDEFGR
jgi:hypothetical protein